MSRKNESPEDRRERLRQQDLRKNSSSAYNGGGLQDLVGGLGWKSTGVIILIIIVLFLIVLFAF
ncbi:DUF6366 family protein [Halobacillus salinarum]|uniref:DUF6366 family protein n=1 Tax=Halobacillus salinarum TaxID=2932257 RepID=A0ABY4ETZ1_9BACI|nr:DUF6366 family protein [Halobacillus salinarum]UOQ45596.1 DUF6366 family protein [Halobacillus salinarum]